MTGKFILEARGIKKSYGGTHALKGVDFSLRPGEIRGLIGSNGAGKSTLFKIIAGMESPTSGEIIVDEEKVDFQSVRDASESGIILIHQELSLFPDLSVAENLFIGREHLTSANLIHKKSQENEAKNVLDILGIQIDPKTLVGALPTGAQQITEIARALTQNPRVLLMDEPTSSLGRSEVEKLFEVVRTLSAQGVAIVYVSHRLDELLEICDTLSVLRDGELVADLKAEEATPALIVEKMTGRAVSLTQTAPFVEAGETILSVEGLNLPHNEHGTGLVNISFNVNAGEVVGIYGLMGAGRTELLETLLGLRPEADGHVSLEDLDLKGLSTADRVDAGLVMLSEDRKESGLIHATSVLKNMTLSILERLSRYGLVSNAKERGHGRDMVEKLGIKLPGLDAPIGSLSGGNQQKVLLARNLLCDPKVLLLDEPTRGVDAAAREDIIAQIRQCSADGKAVILTSSEASEVMATANRIFVLSRGKIVAELNSHETNEAELLEAASVSSVTEKAA